MSEYNTRDERAELEDELEDLPVEQVDTSKLYPRISVRISKDELAAIEHAADAAGVPVSTFIRQSAVATATTEADALAKRRHAEAQIRDLQTALQNAMKLARDARVSVAGTTRKRPARDRDRAAS